MMSELSQHKQPEPRNTTKRSARLVAVVSGLSILFILSLLGMRWLDYTHVRPARENQLTELNLALQEQTGQEELLEKYRQLDLEIRVIRVLWYDLAGRAGYFLAFNLALFLISAKLAWQSRPSTVIPGAKIKYAREYERNCYFGLWSVTAFLLLIAGLGWLAGDGLWPDDYDLAELPDKDTIAPAISPVWPEPGEINANWPRFRGPEGLGRARNAGDPPDHWNIESGRNILWQSRFPLPGQSSPIVWRNRVFLTGATAEQKKVFCYATETGELLWSGQVPDRGISGRELDLYPETGHAPATPYTDGQMVYALFPTGDLAAFDFAGNRQWTINLGRPDNLYGHASSVVGYRDKVIVQYDNGEADDNSSWLFGVDKPTGQVAWRIPRAVASSWTTPIIVETGDQEPQLITVSDPLMVAYNPESGSEIWRASFLSGEIAPSPIHHNGLVMAVSPYLKMAAVQIHGRGTIDKSFFQWTLDQGIPDLTSPASDGERIYLLGTYGGNLAVHNINDGSLLWQEFLGGDFYASPTVVGEKLYLFKAEGVGLVLQAADEYVKLAESSLNEEIYASPAFAGDRIYIRGKEHLFCIGYTE